MSAPDPIEVCRKWIRENCAQRSTFNWKVSSYGLKHRIERAVNMYISNEACIAAFLLEGFRKLRVDGGPNFIFNVKCVTFKL